MRGRLSSVQVLLDDPAQAEAVRQRLERLAPPDAEVAGPRQRSLQIEKMLGGFQLNLTAMSLVSLLVGTFLIYNTIFASAARRRVEVGILRSLGVRRERDSGVVSIRGADFRRSRHCGGHRGRGGAGGGADGFRRADGFLALCADQYWAACVGGAAVRFGGRPRHRVGAGGSVGSGGRSCEGGPGGGAGPWCADGAFPRRPDRALVAARARRCSHWHGSAARRRCAGRGAWLSFAASFFVLVGFAFFAPGVSAVLGKWQRSRGRRCSGSRRRTWGGRSIAAGSRWRRWPARWR